MRIWSNIKHLYVTLRFSILSIFITTLVIMAAAIIAITTFRFSDELSYVSKAIMKSTSAEALRHVHAELYPSAIANQFSAHLISQGALPLDEAHLTSYTLSLLKVLPIAKRVFWIDADGDYVAAEREQNGRFTTRIDRRHTLPNTRLLIYRDTQGHIINTVTSHQFDMDRRQSPWYKEAQQQKQFFWTGVRMFVPPTLSIGITAVAPVLSANGQVQGVFGSDFSLESLSQFMTQQYIPDGFAFIITHNGDLVAYPQKPPFTHLKVPASQLLNVYQINIPLVSQAMALYQKTNSTEFTMRENHITYLVTFAPIPDLASDGWLVGVITPKNYFTKALTHLNFITLGVSLIILMIGVVLVSNLITRVVKPIKLLVKETEKIKHFDLGGEILFLSRIKEVVLLRNALNAMKRGLKNFQKYVPKTLVRRMVSAEKESYIGGARKYVVVFFSDIANFTTIAENADPTQLMKQLCEYFEAMASTINKCNGIIDKYIGDSVMAFWVVQLTKEKACSLAAQAALTCQQQIAELNEKWEKEGKSSFKTRIGLHLGEAIVGNVGSSDRLSYTAIGDTINIASRIEGINKSYATKILISEMVAQQIKDHFDLCLTDYIHVKGRIDKIKVFTLDGTSHSL